MTVLAVLGLALAGLAPAAGSARAQSADSTGTHAVQPGDTLLDIGLFYGVAPGDLGQINHLSGSDTLGAGQELTLPMASQAFAPPAASVDPAAHAVDQPAAAGIPAAPPTEVASPAALTPGTYVVAQGDTLFRIATSYGVSLRALAYLNNIASPDTIYVGQQLQIPNGTEIIPEETPTPAPTPPTPPALDGTGGPSGKWLDEGKHILVVLSQQEVYAYENGNLLGQFLVSTGLPGTPTVTGDFAIYIKLVSQRMIGPDYDLPNVPWVMYFYQGYGLHGTYWHHNFGHPMSHGCVNMRTGEAEWMYGWAPIGTPVHVVQ